MKKILFVCLGNICRSPLAEGIFQDLLVKNNLEDSFFVDSAGTGNWHVGNPPHVDSQRVAMENGIDISHQEARQVEAKDFSQFDFVVAMDTSNKKNLINLMEMNSKSKAKLFCIREYDSESRGDLDVPDPYYSTGDGAEDGFLSVYEMLLRSCKSLLEEIK